MLVTELAFTGEQGSILGQILAVHNQVLPVHIDEQARGINAQAHEAGDIRSKGPDTTLVFGSVMMCTSVHPGSSPSSSADVCLF